MFRFSTALQKPENIFLIIALLLGVGMCFLIPPGAGFDEVTHMARVWEISSGTLIPNQRLGKGPYLPLAFTEVAYRNRFFNTPLESDYWAKFANKRINWNVFTDHITRAVYFPLMYMPQAFVVGLLGRVLDAPVLWMYSLSRLINVFIYALLGYFAIRVVPFGKWLLALMALTPMAIFQAGTISSDPFSDGASLLFIGWVLALAWRGCTLSWKQTGITLGVTALLLAGKPGTVFLLLLLVLLPWRETPARRVWVLLGGTAALFALEAVGWNILIYQNYYANVPGYGASPQLGFILEHPLTFLGTFFNDLWIHGRSYLTEWIGIYAYNTGRVPGLVYPLFGLLIGAVGLLEPAPDQTLTPEGLMGPTRRWKQIRAVLLITFVFGYLFTVIGMYLTTNRTGSPFIEGVQGRYFLIVFPLLYLALIGLQPRLAKRFSGRLPLILTAGSLLVLGLYMGGVYMTYYVTCGTSYYTSGLCYQPPYRNWAPNAHFSEPVTKDITLSQTFNAVCSPIRSVRVWNGQGMTGAQQSTTITLRDAATGSALAEQSVENSSVEPYSWLEVTVPSVENTVGHPYAIEITSNASDASKALAFGQSERIEYKDGQYLINGQQQQADLLFQYGCKTP